MITGPGPEPGFGESSMMRFAGFDEDFAGAFAATFEADFPAALAADLAGAAAFFFTGVAAAAARLDGAALPALVVVLF